MTTDHALADRRFTHQRLVEATAEQLFAAFAHPDRLARWWGPDGFSSTFGVFDFRPGGHWEFVMHGPDGTQYQNRNVFKAIEPPNRIEIEHLSQDHHFVLEITFASHGSPTLVGWRQTFDTVEHKQAIAAWVEPANEQNLERLEREVARTDPGSAT